MLETSNLALRWNAVSTNEKMQNVGVTWPVFLEFWDPPNISGTIDAGNFQFGIDMEGGKYERKKCKIR